ncbi:hypothetical protein JK185_15410, partial [Gluconobacter wancherniae]|uniref:LysR substrate-binding domain-containing protein n=1 Tax=Gluconobacter wancherniae TaxID=1307955 RepID=UPI001BC434C1
KPSIKSPKPANYRPSTSINGSSIPPLHGPLFDQFSFVVSAALYGDGVALIPKIFIERELKNGQLLELPANTLESEGSYYLVNPTSRGLTNSFMLFKKWILQN